MTVYNSIQLDLCKKNSYKAIPTKQLDTNSRFIKVELLNNGNSYDFNDDVTVILASTRNGETKAYECSVEDNYIVAPLTSWMLAKEGYVDCEIVLVDTTSNSKLSSFVFSIYVDESIYNDETISQDENYNVLLQLLTDVDTAVKSCNAAADKATEIYNTVETKLNNGELKGEPGPQGEPGPRGDAGKDYVLTNEDLQKISTLVEVPTKTSELQNDSNFVSDDNYIHTDNNFTTVEKQKLGTLANYDDTAIKKQIAEKQNELSTEQLNNISAVPDKIDKSQVGNGLKFADGQLQLDIPKGDNNKLELIGTYTFAEDSSTTTVWSLPSDADYLGLCEVYIIVDLKSNSHGVTDIPYLNYWDRVSNSRTLMCQLCPCWKPVTTNPPSVMNRCIYNGRIMNGTMYPLYARYGNSKQYPYSINDHLSAQTYTLSRNTPYLNEIQLQCNGAGIGAGTTVELWGVKYYE